MPDYQYPIGVVDLALFTIREQALCLVLHKRRDLPFRGALALPGGFVHVDEDVDAEATAVRVIRDKLGITAPYLEQLYTFSGRARDPRGWSISIAYYALIPESTLPAQNDAAMTVLPIDKLPALPFDHDKIVALALGRLRGKSTYSSLPAFLLDEPFTINALHAVYEQVIGTRLDKASFRRKVIEQGMLEPADGQREGGAHRPAQLYRKSLNGLQQLKYTI